MAARSVPKLPHDPPEPVQATIPPLKLEATAWNGTGKLNGVTTIQRLDTHGGSAEGACDSRGTFLSVPYTADYTFYRKPDRSN